MSHERTPNPESDRGKDPTPSKLRNDHARWKDHDQPDPPRRHPPDPERDYPDADEGVPQ